jgi:hypothetical protein
MKIKYKHETIVEIEFRGGQVCKIDKSDLLIFAQYSWFSVKAHNTHYLYRNGDSKTIAFHTEIMKTPNGLEIDHINGDGLDNRKANLRIVTHLINQNNFVARPLRNGKSKYRYVNWCNSRNIWRVQVRYNDKTKTVGSYDDELEAAHAANNYIILNKLPKVLNEF